MTAPTDVRAPVHDANAIAQAEPTASSIVANLALASVCGATPAAQLIVALLTAAPRDFADAAAVITRGATAWPPQAARLSLTLGRLAELGPELEFEPDLARVREDVTDHEIRGRLLFAEMVGRKSFFQTAAFAIAGLDLTSGDAELLEHLGVNTQLMDARIWPLAITRRVAASGAGVANAVLAGLAALLNPNMAVQPVGAFMRVLDVIDREVSDGTSLEECLRARMERRERIAGIARPALGPDERNRGVFDLARRYGRERGPSFTRALEIDEFYFRAKGLHINSAGLQGALMRDMGFTPRQATAFCTIYFLVPVLAQAVFSEESATRRQGRIEAGGIARSGGSR